MDTKIICLGALMLGDQSGYEIRKQFQDGPFAHFHQAGFGSIYPALNSLLAEGLVTCTEEEQSGKPDKKIYSLTESGRAALTTALHANPNPDRVRSDIIFTMFFADLVDDDHLAKVYDGYLDGFRAHLAQMEQWDHSGASDGRQFVRAMGLHYYRSMVDFLETNRHDLLGAEVISHPHSQTTDDAEPRPTEVGVGS